MIAEMLGINGRYCRINRMLASLTRLSDSSSVSRPHDIPDELINNSAIVTRSGKTLRPVSVARAGVRQGYGAWNPCSCQCCLLSAGEFCGHLGGKCNNNTNPAIICVNCVWKHVLKLGERWQTHNNLLFL